MGKGEFNGYQTISVVNLISWILEFHYNNIQHINFFFIYKVSFKLNFCICNSLFLLYSWHSFRQ